MKNRETMEEKSKTQIRAEYDFDYSNMTEKTFIPFPTWLDNNYFAI
jgi:hypothetical protein